MSIALTVSETWPRPDTPAWMLLHFARNRAEGWSQPEKGVPLRVLHLLSQQPGKTGSGIYLQALVQQGAQSGMEQRVVIGIPAEAPFPVISPLDEGQINPVRFGTPSLPFPVPGMSDVMPYESTRFSEFTRDILDAYLQAFRGVLTGVVREFAPHIIHSHHLWLVTALARVLFPETPVVATCHGTDLRQLELVPDLVPFVVPACSGLDRVMALHERQRNRITAIYGIDNGRITLTGAGYRSDIFCRPASPTDRRDQKESLSIVYAGKISRAKGLPWLIEAMDRLTVPPGTEVRLLIAGSAGGVEGEAIRAKAIGRENQLVFLGALPQEELAEVLKGVDLFVLPSFYEGLPLVVLEAVACGCRVVVTDLPGMDSWLPEELDRSGIVERVSLPRLIGPDEPASGELPGFTARLATAISRQLGRCLRGEAYPYEDALCSIETMTWEGVFRRVEKAYLEILD